MSEPTPLTEAERESLESILVALWQAETERGYDFNAAKVYATVERILAARTSTATADTGLRIDRPQIYTGPKHMTVDEATSMYLMEAASRVRVNRYWGSGVTRLVADLLDDVAAALDATPASTEDRADNEGTR